MHSILKFVFLEIQNKAIRPVLSGPVTITFNFTMYIKIFFYIEKLQTQVQEITNQLQMLHLKQMIQPGAFHKD